MKNSISQKLKKHEKMTSKTCYPFAGIVAFFSVKWNLGHPRWPKDAQSGFPGTQSDQKS